MKIGLKEADRLVSTGEIEEAIDRLIDLDTQYPGHRPVLQHLMAIGVEFEVPDALIVAGEGLARLNPDDTVAQMALTPAYYEAGYIFLSIDSGRRLSKTLAGTDELVELAGQLAEIEADLSSLLEGIGLGGEGGFEIAVQLDRARLRLKQERFSETQAICAEILAARPDFIPAMTMTGQASFAEGDLASAITFSEKALAVAPDDVDSLANAVRYYVTAGQTDMAKAAGVKLKATPVTEEILTLPVLAGLSYLGDDRACWKCFPCSIRTSHKLHRPSRQLTVPCPGRSFSQMRSTMMALMRTTTNTTKIWKKSSRTKWRRSLPTARHYAAVALGRLGRIDEAVVQWNMALNLDPEP